MPPTLMSQETMCRFVQERVGAGHARIRARTAHDVRIVSCETTMPRASINSSTSRKLKVNPQYSHTQCAIIPRCRIAYCSRAEAAKIVSIGVSALSPEIMGLGPV